MRLRSVVLVPLAMAPLLLLFLSVVLFLSSSAESQATGKQAMVSTTHHLATEAALEVLRKGGNAADAAAVVQFMLSVIQPQSTGLGGGCFILYYHAKEKKVYALDGREEAPALFHGRQFCESPDCLHNPKCDCPTLVPLRDRQTGGHSAGVPGTVKATAKFLEDFGTTSLKQALGPAIRAAREGFPMYDKLHQEILNHADRLSLFQSSSRLFLDPSNLTQPICAIGETFYNPDIAETLELLAQDGPEVFYTGQIGKEIVQAARAGLNPNTGKHGLMEPEDLEGYLPVYRQPINITYRGHTVFGFPPPSAGGVALLQMLNFLEGFDLGAHGPLTADSLHRMIDAQNVAFADRGKFLADADFAEVPLEGLLDKGYMAERREGLFDPARAIPTPIRPGNPAGQRARYGITRDDHEVGTTHWSVVDPWGNAASFTSTIEQNLGSALVVPGRGFLLNNELTDFESFEADESGAPLANAPEGGKRPRRTALGPEGRTLGGKRPRSSMTPTLLFNTSSSDALYMVIGSPGGSSITGAVLNVLLNIVDFGLGVEQATVEGRALGKNGETSAEKEIYEADGGEVFRELGRRGFNFSSPEPTTATYGRVQTVVAGKDGVLYGAADTKREPQASAGGY